MKPAFLEEELRRLKIYIYLTISQAVKEENEESLQQNINKTLLVDK